jgi:hypothetical protein
MANFSRFGITEPLSSGIDFYTGDEQVVQATISAEGNLVINAIKLSHAVITLSVESNANTNITKIAHASSNINEILSVVATVATERHDALVSVSAESNVAVSITKIALASSSIDIASGGAFSDGVDVIKIASASTALSAESDVVANAKKISLAASALSGEITASQTAKKIAFAAAALSVETTVTTGAKISLATIRINILNNTSISTAIIRYAANTSVGQDTTLIRTLLLLDNKPLTNHNRQLSMEVQPVFVENKIWNNRGNRYYKSSSRGGRRVFNLSWSMVPNSSLQTADGKDGRDFFASIASDPDYHVLKIVNMDASGATPDTETEYNVLVKDYSEKIIRRDISNEIYLWDCSMTLEEV